MQSWLVSLVLGLAEEVAGFDGVRVVITALTVGVFAVTWRLSRPAQGLLVRAGIGTLVVAVGAGAWSERPLLVGLLLLGLTVLAAQGSLDPRWLLPIGWIWVNSHGSFPLGVVYLAVIALGHRLDHLDGSVELRCLRWLVGGFVLGALNPLGPRLLLFPLELVQQQDVLRNVVEWQAPAFQSLTQRLFLLQALLAIVAIVRRPRYTNALVVAVFLAAALLGSRNVPVASIAFVPVLASAWPNVGSLRADARTRLASILGLVGVLAIAALVVVRLGEPGVDLERYPTDALELLDEGGVDLEEVRMAAPDKVGNLLELRDGPGEAVFYDDRFDMFPEDVSEDALALFAGRPRAVTVLDDHRIDLVLWTRDSPLVAILGSNPAWRALDESDADWLLFCRVGVPLSADLGTC